jgi:hypothetical protein
MPKANAGSRSTTNQRPLARLFFLCFCLKTGTKTNLLPTGGACVWCVRCHCHCHARISPMPCQKGPLRLALVARHVTGNHSCTQPGVIVLYYYTWHLFIPSTPTRCYLLRTAHVLFSTTCTPAPQSLKP